MLIEYVPFYISHLLYVCVLIAPQNPKDSIVFICFLTELGTK